MRNLTRVLLLAGLTLLFVSPVQAGGLFKKCFKKNRGCCVAAPCEIAPAPVCCTPAPAPTCCPTVVAAPEPSCCGAPESVAVAPMNYGVASPAPMPSYQPTPSHQPMDVQSVPRASYPSSPATEMQTAPATPSAAGVSWEQAFQALRNFVESSADIESVCSMKSKFPQYGQIINGLNNSERMEGGLLCFPNESTWNSRPEIAAEMTAVLRSAGASL